MASKLIKDPVTQAASCDVPRAKLDIDYLTVSDTTSMCLHMQRASTTSGSKCGGQATIFKELKF